MEIPLVGKRSGVDVRVLPWKACAVSRSRSESLVRVACGIWAFLTRAATLRMAAMLPWPLLDFGCV